MTPAGRTRVRWLAGAAALLGGLWLLWDTVLLLPLRLLVVLFHELGHGLAALATGGQILEIAVTPREGGWCECPGGDAFLTLSSGYLGSLAWGAVFVRAAGLGGRWGRAALAGLGAVLLALTALYLRTLLALGLGAAFGAGLLWAAARLPAAGRRAALLAVGATSCLYAVLDVKSDVLERPGEASDATALAQLTGLPAWLWGAVWIAVSLAVCAWLLRAEWRRA